MVNRFQGAIAFVTQCRLNLGACPKSPPSLNYLAIRLKDGDRWHFEPSPAHTVCWVAVQAGGLEVGEPIATGELVVFEESTAAIEFAAKGDTLFILGSSIKHPHPLVLGHSRFTIAQMPDRAVRPRLDDSLNSFRLRFGYGERIDDSFYSVENAV